MLSELSEFSHTSFGELQSCPMCIILSVWMHEWTNSLSSFLNEGHLDVGLQMRWVSFTLGLFGNNHFLRLHEYLIFIIIYFIKCITFDTHYSSPAIYHDSIRCTRTLIIGGRLFKYDNHILRTVEHYALKFDFCER